MSRPIDSIADMPSTGDPRRWWILIVVSLAEFMVGLDATIVNVMTPELQKSLDLTASSVQWVISIYVVTLGGLLLLGGRLTDVLGRRRVLLSGLTLFTAGSLLAATSDGKELLLGARAIQGVGAAALSPAALSILVMSFPDKEERTKAFGVWATVIGVGAAIGTLVGGVIVDVGWRWAFFLNIPVGIALGVGALALIPGGRAYAAARRSDLAGAIVSTAGLLALVFGIVNTAVQGWGSALTIGPLVAAVVLLSAFVWIEATTPEPLLPLRLFRRRPVVASMLGQFLVAGLMLPTFFMLPQYMQSVLHYSPMETGLAYLPTAVGILVFATVAAQLLPKVGATALFSTGVVLLGAMAFLMLGSETSVSYWALLFPVTALLGTGLVLCLIPTPAVGTSEATEEDAGTISALLNAALQIGGALGLAVVVTIVTSRLEDPAAGGGYAEHLNYALHGGFSVMFGWVILALLVGVLGFRGLSPAPEGTMAEPAGTRAAA